MELSYTEQEMLEEQRRLLRLMFASLIVEPNTKVLTYAYTKPFQILSRLVELTNNSKANKDEAKKPKTFELPERIDLPIQTNDFLYAYPEMRRRWDSNPRYPFGYATFPRSCTRPLCDSSS